jgi:CheY-like chemotaxis protein
VLLVSADLDARLRYAAILEEGGFSLFAVPDAIEALKTMSVRIPDVVVLGSGSSGRDSLRLLSALRGDRWTSDIPAVILTSARVQAGGETSGTTLLLPEDVGADVLLNAVHDLAQETPAERFARRQLRRTLITLRSVLVKRAAIDQTIGTNPAGWSPLITAFRTPVLALDEHGAYVAASAGMEALTGYVSGELTGMSVFDTALGAHLPFALVWQTHRESSSGAGRTSVRDKTGRTLTVAFLLSALTPHLHFLLLAPTS